MSNLIWKHIICVKTVQVNKMFSALIFSDNIFAVKIFKRVHFLLWKCRNLSPTLCRYRFKIDKSEIEASLHSVQKTAPFWHSVDVPRWCDVSVGLWSRYLGFLCLENLASQATYTIDIHILNILTSLKYLKSY